MRPTPIPDEEVPDGYRRLVVAPPDGDMTNPDIAPVEAVFGLIRLGEGSFAPGFAMRLVLEDGELERMASGEPVWLYLVGNRLVPFDVSIAGPDTR